jgi:hypothetical protein
MTGFVSPFSAEELQQYLRLEFTPELAEQSEELLNWGWHRVNIRPKEYKAYPFLAYQQTTATPYSAELSQPPVMSMRGLPPGRPRVLPDEEELLDIHDHDVYLLLDGTRPMTGNLEMAGSVVWMDAAKKTQISGTDLLMGFGVNGATRMTLSSTNLNPLGTVDGRDVAADGALLDKLEMYSGISVVDNAVVTAIGVMGTAVQVTVFDTNSPSNGITPDHTNDHITIPAGGTGDYMIWVSATVNSVAGPGSRFEMTVQKNNGTSNVGALHCDRNLGGGGTESGVVSMSGIATLTAADTLEVWIENETGTENYVVQNIDLSIRRLS